MAAKEAKKWGFYWFVLVLLLNELGIIFLFLPASSVEAMSLQEERMVASQLGEDTLEYVVEKSGRVFQRWLLDTGVVAASFTFCGYQGKDRFDDRGLGYWLYLRLQVLWMAVRQMLFRLEVMVLWLPVAAVFLGPALADGLAERGIRKYRFSYASPLVHRNTSLLLHLLAAAAILLPLLPVSIPPLAYPAALAAGGLAVWWMVLNIQKRM